MIMKGVNQSAMNLKYDDDDFVYINTKPHTHFDWFDLKRNYQNINLFYDDDDEDVSIWS